uniref:Exonuclease domain-containing protein n=1 Tax=Clastoptera arizonana TaxID=38151 RepID=A0A1B6EF18_9HEMI
MAIKVIWKTHMYYRKYILFSDQSINCPSVSTDTNNTTNFTIQANNKTILQGEQLIKLRQSLRERKKEYKNIPRLRLRNAGEDADLSQVSKRTPLFLSDVQHLLMYSQLGQYSPYEPRWAHIEKATEISHTVLLLIEGVSVYDYITTESICPNLSTMDIRVEMVSPFSYGGSIVEEICSVPLSKTQKAKLERRFGNLNDAVQSNDKVFRVLRSMFPIDYTPPIKHLMNYSRTQSRHNIPPQDKFSRTELLLSAWQLVEEGFPLPLKGELSNRYSTYVLTKDSYTEVTAFSPMYGVDCEMCQTIDGNELTRISIVNEDHQVVYETLVKPYNKIRNYLTQFSGITPAMLKNVTKRLEHVQQDLRALLPPDVILVGQSLNNDLHALKMMHPYVIDTSVIFNLSGERHRKSKLSLLSNVFLNELIQQGTHGHDSVEDSMASLKLVQLKLSKSPEFGDAVICGRQYQNFNTQIEIKQPEEKNKFQTNNDCNLATSLFSHVASQNKTVSLVTSTEVLSEYTTYITAATFSTDECTKVECQVTASNSEAIKKTLEEAAKHKFCMTHLQLQEGENISNVDKWASQLIRNGNKNSLVIVVLAGNPSSKSNGAAFLHLQKKPLSELLQSPLLKS